MLIVVNLRLHTFLCRLGNEHCNHLFAECMQFSAPFLGQIRGIELSATPKTNNMPKNVSCQSVQPPIFVCCPSCGVFRGEKDAFFFFSGSACDGTTWHCQLWTGAATRFQYFLVWNLTLQRWWHKWVSWLEGTLIQIKSGYSDFVFVFCPDVSDVNCNMLTGDWGLNGDESICHHLLCWKHFGATPLRSQMIQPSMSLNGWKSNFLEFWIFTLFIPPKLNIALEKWWLEEYFPIGKATFQGLC